jgi:hypothetical protein
MSDSISVAATPWTEVSFSGAQVWGFSFFLVPADSPRAQPTESTRTDIKAIDVDRGRDE